MADLTDRERQEERGIFLLFFYFCMVALFYLFCFVQKNRVTVDKKHTIVKAQNSVSFTLSIINVYGFYLGHFLIF